MTEKSQAPEKEKHPGGRKQGELNREKFRAWLASVDVVPANDRGGAHVTEMERILGINRNAFYTNPGLRAMLEAAIQEKGLRPIQTKDAGPTSAEDSYVKQLEGRVKSLEQRISTKDAEIEALRAKLRRYDAIEKTLMTTGRLAR